jgi:hypothetical protein
MAREAIWLCFDLGVQGDYESLYSWLDGHDARECGDSLAWLSYDHSGDLVEDLKRDLKAAVAIDRRSRVYVVVLVGGKIKGKFLFGNRRSAPWTGYAPSEEPAEDSSSGEEHDA